MVFVLEIGLNPTYWIIGISIYTIIALSIIASLLLNGVRPTKTLAWLLAIFTIPVGGVFLYLMLGRNRRKRKIHKILGSVEGQKLPIEVPNWQTRRQEKISRIIHQLTGFHATINNKFSYLKDGKVTFDHIFSALENANDFIHIQYYIFEEGKLAQRLFDIFQQKRNEGVRIRLIYDSIGSLSLSRKYIRSLEKIGVQTFAFLPLRYGKYLASLNYRNHRKIIIVDGKVGFTGGINISDKYMYGDPKLGTWHDMHIKVEGSAAKDLNRVFLKDWEIVSGERNQFDHGKELHNLDEKHIVQVVPDSPDDDYATVEHLFLSIITTSKDYLYIANPYVIPSLPIERALENAALSGVDVRILVSEKADSSIVNLCVQSYFESMLKSGIKIYLYPEGFLHSKYVVSDDEIATIGTSNLDERSFQQNYEVNAVVYDSGLSSKLKSDFLSDCNISNELELEIFEKRPIAIKMMEGIARVLSPVL